MMNSTIRTPPVFLCGMMGSGKSTVGRILASRMDMPFVDMDDLIEQQEGMTISEIFSRKGEKTFRKIEKELVMKTVDNSGCVIALGGGALQDQQITDHLKNKGWLIFLDAPLSVLSRRLANDTKRPLLQQAGKEKIRIRIDRLLKERKKYYLQSHITIDTGRLSPETASHTIINKIKMNES
ncbi:MAG: shikimate kinase [Balneolaceae bacterium]